MKYKEGVIRFIACVNGTLYFAIAASGASNLEKLFDLQHGVAKNLAYGFGAGASLCNVMFYYKTLEGLTIKPESTLARGLTMLAPVAALSFLTAGKEGGQFLGMNTTVATVCGVTLYGLRIVSMVDSSVKFPKRLAEIRSSWPDAFSRRDYKELARIAATIYTASAFSASITDSVYSAVIKFGAWVGAAPKSPILVGLGYSSCVLGALDTFPLILYWTHRGIKQITYGGKPDASGVNSDPTDSCTFFAVAATIPVILAVLGMVTAAEGMAFGQLGTFAVTLRLSSTIIYSVAAGVPGLSSLFRGLFLSSKKPESLSLVRGEKIEPSRGDDLVSVSVNKENTTQATSSWFGLFGRAKRRDYAEIPDDPENRKRSSYSCTIM